jgi:hypothetical protein
VISTVDLSVSEIELLVEQKSDPEDSDFTRTITEEETTEPDQKARKGKTVEKARKKGPLTDSSKPDPSAQ